MARLAFRAAILLLACFFVAGAPLSAFAQDDPAEASADDFDFDFDEVEESADEGGITDDDLARASKASSPPLGDKIYDAAVLRPLRTVELVVGTTLFVPAAIITSPSGTAQIGEAWDIFVVATYEDAYDRPLGRL